MSRFADSGTSWLFPDIRLHLIVTEHFMELDGLIEPDVIITKNPPREPEFDVEPLFHDIVYPVCSPAFHERHFHGRPLKPLDLLSRPTLNLSMLGRVQDRPVRRVFDGACRLHRRATVSIDVY